QARDGRPPVDSHYARCRYARHAQPCAECREREEEAALFSRYRPVGGIRSCVTVHLSPGGQVFSVLGLFAAACVKRCIYRSPIVLLTAGPEGASIGRIVRR